MFRELWICAYKLKYLLAINVERLGVILIRSQAERSSGSAALSKRNDQAVALGYVELKYIWEASKLEDKYDLG